MIFIRNAVQERVFFSSAIVISSIHLFLSQGAKRPFEKSLLTASYFMQFHPTDENLHDNLCIRRILVKYITWPPVYIFNAGIHLSAEVILNFNNTISSSSVRLM